MKHAFMMAAALYLVACAGTPAGEDDPADVRAVRETIRGFDAALRAADFDRVSALLDPEVVVLEAGGAERSREEYLAEHARADAEFLKRARSLETGNEIHVAGDAAWSTKTSVMQFDRDGKPATVHSAETMILRRGPDGWRIVHMHWSSRT
jgi:ketosteroid isomerase-like protein